MKLHNPFRVALVATLGVGVGLLLITSVQALSTILLYVGTALFLSLGLDPIISFLEKRGMRRWAAVLVTILGVLGVFAGLILLVVPIIVNQVTQLIAQIETFVQQSNGWDAIVDQLQGWLQDSFPGLQWDQIFGYVTQWFTSLDLGTVSGSVGEGVLAAIGALITGVGGAFIVLILTIYFTASTPSLKAAVYQLVPATKRPRFIDLAEQITASVGFYVIGQLSLGAINGVLSAILLTIIDAPFPAVLAVIAFFFSLIPLVGTLTGSTIIALTCLLTSPGTALIAAVYYLIYMQIEAYVISPRIMNRAVSIPGAVVVIAALAGGALGQLLGALVAIPVAASILIIYRQVIIPRQNER